MKRMKKKKSLRKPVVIWEHPENGPDLLCQTAIAVSQTQAGQKHLVGQGQHVEVEAAHGLVHWVGSLLTVLATFIQSLNGRIAFERLQHPVLAHKNLLRKYNSLFRGQPSLFAKSCRARQDPCGRRDLGQGASGSRFPGTPRTFPRAWGRFC